MERWAAGLFSVGAREVRLVCAVIIQKSADIEFPRLAAGDEVNVGTPTFWGLVRDLLLVGTRCCSGYTVSRPERVQVKSTGNR